MHITKDFKLVNKKNYIVGGIIGFFGLCAITLFVVTTSRFKYDNEITKFFYRAMDYDFFRGGTEFCINNDLIITVMIPVGFVLIEALYAYKKKYSPNSYGARHFNDKKGFYYVMYVVYPIVSGLFLADCFFGDYGFGAGYDYMHITGGRYTIPSYIVGFIMNMGIYFGLMYYIRYDIAKRENFLESGIGKRAFVAVLLVILVYIVVLILKNGFERPYYYNLHGHDYLVRIKADDPKAYETYMNQHGSDINLGGGPRDGSGGLDNDYPTSLQDGPGYRTAHGFFKPHGYLYNNSPDSDAFPSGHMGMTSMMLCALGYVYFNDTDTKKHSILKYVMGAVGILYITNMFFCLLISLGHGASDLSFTLIYAPIAFFISKYAVDSIVRIVKKNYANSFNALK